jgi:hypothetical protein
MLPLSSPCLSFTRLLSMLLVISVNLCCVSAAPLGGVFSSGSTGGYGVTPSNSFLPSLAVDRTISVWMLFPAGVSDQSDVGIWGMTNVNPAACSDTRTGFHANNYNDAATCIGGQLQIGGVCGIACNCLSTSAMKQSASHWSTSWNNVVYVVTVSSNTYSVYINGVLVGSGSQSGYGSRSPNLKFLYLGGGFPGPVQIDDVRIWSRALTAVQVASEFQSASPASANLNLWYTFDNCPVNANAVTDINNGLAMNFVSPATVMNLSMNIFYFSVCRFCFFT